MTEMLQSTEPPMAEPQYPPPLPPPEQQQQQQTQQFREYPQFQNRMSSSTTTSPMGGGDYTPQYASNDAAVVEAKKTAFIIIGVLLVGLLLLVFGIISFQAEKIVGKELNALPGNAYAEVTIFCSPCGAPQESSLRGIMGNDGYINRFHGSGSAANDRLNANLSGLEIKELAKKEWVKKIELNTQ